MNLVRPALVGMLLAGGCGSGPRGEHDLVPGGTDTDGPEGTSATTDAGDTSPGSVKLDVGDGQTGGGDLETGCSKVDFLFVIDNSGSMAEEQQNLIASFPGFVEAIESHVSVDDFHVMVVDVDTSFIEDQCQEICPNNPEDTCIACASDAECVDVQCSEFPPPQTCDTTMGAGRVTTPGGGDCGVVGGQRFVTSAQPDLGEAFACAAEVGTAASGERPMLSMVEAVGPQAADGGCNEGFVRDDAILVVVVITDEADDANDDGIASPGDPAAWREALVAAKQGDDEAIVFLSLIGDSDVGGGVCPDGAMPEAAPAPQIRALAETFAYGSVGSVCADDYSPFFAEAISVIDTACDEFVPPG